MSVNDHWVYQGRQSHGWFGTGTAPKEGDDDAAGANELFRPSNASERVDAAAHLIIASVPRNERGRWSYAASDTGRDRLKTAVAAWYGASAMRPRRVPHAVPQPLHQRRDRRSSSGCSTGLD